MHGEKSDTYRFANHEERVIDLPSHVVRVSVETLAIVETLKGGPRWTRGLEAPLLVEFMEFIHAR